MATIYNQIDANRRKTWLIMFLFTAFIAVVAYVFTFALGYEGPSALGFVGIFLIIAGFLNFFSYFWSDKVVIALSGAKLIEKNDNPELYRTVENLCIGFGLPPPKVYIIDDPAPNAFATGRDPNHAVVAVTTGLLAGLEKIELEGVLAHELSHIKNYDTRVMTIVVILVGLVALLTDVFMRSFFWGGGRRSRDRDRGAAIFMVVALVLAILAPIVAQLIKFAISRKREFLADASGALLTRYPEGLAKALEKIASYPDSTSHATAATAHLYIVNPFRGQEAKSWFTHLFSTHPPVEERIKILRSM